MKIFPGFIKPLGSMISLIWIGNHSADGGVRAWIWRKEQSVSAGLAI